MTALFYCQGDDGSMFQAFADSLGTENIVAWKQGLQFDKSVVETAIVWMPPEDFFDGLHNLTHVFTLAAGVDQLLGHPGLSADVNLVRLQDAGMGVQMAEYVLYGVLHAHRRFQDFRSSQAIGQWSHGAGVRQASEVSVGILGAGVLGQQVARRLYANGYPVACWSRTEKTLPDGVDGKIGDEALPQFLSNSNVLVCLLPLTDRTRGILNTSLFASLPNGAFLINVARGGHLVDADLIAAIDSGQVSGALLDVFHQEPLPAEHPFWHHPRITVTPHEAANSVVEHSVRQTLASMECLKRGERPPGLVDRTRGY